MIVCVCPGLFTIPAPCIVSRCPCVLIVTAAGSALKVIESTVALAESVSEVCLEVLNVAVSPGLTGALGDQLVAVFQSPETGADSIYGQHRSRRRDEQQKRDDRSGQAAGKFLGG